MEQQVKPYNQNSQKKEQVEQMFDTIAPRYDLLNRLLSLGIDQSWRRALVRIVRLSGARRILDVATGTGDLAILLAKGGGSVTGCDLSPRMIELGRAKVAQRSLNISMELADAENLPFTSGSFDGLTCAFGVRNFGDLEGGLSEFYRVLSSGGSLFILEFSTPTNSFMAWVYKFYFHRLLPMVGGLISGDRRAYSYLPKSVDAFVCGDKFLSLLRGAGFCHCSMQHLTFGVATIYTAIKK
ncbi:MAG: bifunctional demethylmenaquinone methyltransferase/2-methoxy-6-polyprenyl-1,4-benzoquinol methylase UbiE [Mucinivorans sp.]